MNDKSENKFEEESPPLFKTWKGWYILVIVNLSVLILLFYLFKKFFE